jgi:hypothetical protein
MIVRTPRTPLATSASGLGAAGDPGEITIRLANGGFGGSFVISNSDHSETLRS